MPRFDFLFDCTARHCWEAVDSTPRPPHHEAGGPSWCYCEVVGDDDQFICLTTVRWWGPLETRCCVYASNAYALLAAAELYLYTVRTEAEYDCANFRLA